MNERYIEQRVIGTLRERIGDEKVVIERETRLFEIGDSLDRIEAVMELEEEFEISIPDADQEKIHTVGELIEYVEQRSPMAASADPSQENNTP